MYAVKWSIPTSVIIIGVIVLLWFLFGTITLERKEISSSIISSAEFNYSENFCEKTVLIKKYT